MASRTNNRFIKRKLSRLKHEFYESGNLRNNFPVEEISKKTGMRKTCIINALNYNAINNNPLSLDATIKIDSDSNCTLHEIIPSNENTEIKALKNIDNAEIHTVLKKILTEKEYAIIMMRFDGHTMRDVGNKFNLTESRISQIIKEIKKKVARRYDPNVYEAPGYSTVFIAGA
jgi:RNA polymerase sigma factor (sigma-70 family)